MKRRRAATAETSHRVYPDWEAILFGQIKDAGYPLPVKQFAFHPSRKWRADFSYPGMMLLIEVEGGIYRGREGYTGRHTTAGGFTKDCEKYNEAVLLGYDLLRFTPAMVRDGVALETIGRALTRAKGNRDDKPTE